MVASAAFADGGIAMTFKVLFVTPEFEDYVRVGGLASVGLSRPDEFKSSSLHMRGRSASKLLRVSSESHGSRGERFTSHPARHTLYPIRR